MDSPPSYARNNELFAEFRSLQAQIAHALAGQPEVIGQWLETQPRRSAATSASAGAASKTWRTARLSTARRRELAALIAPGETSPDRQEALGRWLLASVPVRTYLEIAAAARPSLGERDPGADRLCGELGRRREELFLANYGLARAAARHGPPQDYDDRVSAASSGLLDAIDRYAPGPQAARFGYFATYWIRYHLTRHAQKASSVVAFPVHQQRLGRRIERGEAGRSGPGNGAAAPCEWHHSRPKIVWLDAVADGDSDADGLASRVCDPAPRAGWRLDESAALEQLHRLLRDCIQPAARVMLAYTRGIGALADAAQDYLEQMHQTAARQLEGPVRGLRRGAGR